MTCTWEAASVLSDFWLICTIKIKFWQIMAKPRMCIMNYELMWIIQAPTCITRGLAACPGVTGAVNVVFHDFKRGTVLKYSLIFIIWFMYMRGEVKIVNCWLISRMYFTWISCKEAIKSSSSSSSSINFPQSASCSNLFSDENRRIYVKANNFTSLSLILSWWRRKDLLNTLDIYSLSGPSCFLMEASSWVMSSSRECISPTRL